METLTYEGTLVVTACWCGIRVGIPDSLYRQAYNHGKVVFCPLGHEFVWHDTEEKRLKRKLENERQDRVYAESRVTALRDQLSASERSAAAYKGHVTRLRNRIANGVCPVDGCRRPFQQVARHIERMHPEWAAEHEDVLHP